MTSTARALFMAMTLAGCGGTKAPAESAAPAAASPAPEVTTPSSDSAPAENAAPSGAPPASAPGSATESAAQPPKPRGAPVEIAVVGKFAGNATVEPVIQGVKTGLQNCYETGLANAPTAKGTVDFKVHVTASGSLKKVESANPTTMPGSITSCMVGRFGAVSFQPMPASTIDVKVTCRPNE